MLYHEFHCRSSRLLFSIMLIVLMGTIGAVIYLPIVWYMKCVLVLCVIIYGSVIVWRYVLLRHVHSILQLHCLGNGKWHIQTVSHRYEASLMRDSIVTQMMMLLRFHVQGKRFPLTTIILRDALGNESYRRLIAATRFF